MVSGDSRRGFRERVWGCGSVGVCGWPQEIFVARALSEAGNLKLGNLEWWNGGMVESGMLEWWNSGKGNAGKWNGGIASRLLQPSGMRFATGSPSCNIIPTFHHSRDVLDECRSLGVAEVAGPADAGTTNLEGWVPRRARGAHPKAARSGDRALPGFAPARPYPHAPMSPGDWPIPVGRQKTY